MSITLSSNIDLDHGPMLSTTVSINDERRSVYDRFFRSPPQPVTAQVLVDTGATITCLDEGIVKDLHLTATGKRRIIVPGATRAELWPTYQVDLLLWDYNGRKHDIVSLEVVCSRIFLNRPHRGLLGRDVLNAGRMHYDGQRTSFTLEF